MGKYKRLSLEEREIIYAGIESGKSFRDIGKGLGRDHTTLSREWKRNAKYGKPYVPCKAHKKATKKGESIDPISEEEIKMVEDKMNHTPRKCLQFSTPYEKMQELLHREMAKSFS